MPAVTVGTLQFGWKGYPDTVVDPELGAFIRQVNVSLRALVNDMQSQVLYRTILPSTWSNISGFSATNRRFLLQDGTAADPPTWSAIAASDITSGILGLARGGTNADLSATGGAANYLKQASVGAPVTVGTIPASDIGSGAALTKVNDTNVTLTLTGSPTTALLAATGLTLGWTGLLGLARGGTNADLSATGAASNVLKQVSVGAAITVGQLAFTDISGTVANGQLLSTYAAITTLANLTTIGTLVAGAVPASLVTAGTFPGATYTMQQLVLSPANGTLVFQKTGPTNAWYVTGQEGAGANWSIFSYADTAYVFQLKATGILSVNTKYQISGTDVLTTTTLGTGVLTSSLTTVGALASGSIAAGFGNINNASNSLTTGALTASSGTLNGASSVAAGSTSRAWVVTTTGATNTSLQYDLTDRLDIGVVSTGATTITSVGTAPAITLANVVALGSLGIVDGSVGVSMRQSVAGVGGVAVGAEAINTFASGVTTQGIAFQTQVVTAAVAFTLGTGYGLVINGANKGAGSAITTLYGLYVSSQTAGGTNYAIYTNTGPVSFGDAVTVRSGGIAVTGASTFSSTVSGITTLTATTLAGALSTATQNSVTTMTGLVTVGALTSGSIGSGFGSINVGANAVTGGAASFTTGAFSGSVGVWVASPGAHLEVVTGTSEARISFAAASGGILQIRGNTGGDSDIQLNAYSGTPLLNFRSSSAVLLATLTNLGVWNMQGNAVSMGALTCTTVGCGAITSTSTIATQDPGQGAGLWKLGKKIVGSGLGIVTNNYVEVMIDGVAVKLAEAA